MIGGYLLCIGDSLTYGARDEKGLHYPELLARKLSHHHDQYWTAINCGVSGETSAQILRRNYHHVKAHPEAGEVFLWAGFNDAKYTVATDPEDYRANMESMIRTILFAGRALYLFDLPKMEGFGAPDFVNNDLITDYNVVLCELFEKYKDIGFVAFVNVREIPSVYRNDGVHLTHAGNDWVAGRVMDSIHAARMRQPRESVRIDKSREEKPTPPPSTFRKEHEC